MSPADLARDFIAAMNAYDADALVALLTADAELHGFKGTYVGHEEARRWLGTPGPNLRSSITIDDLRENDDCALVAATREWIWVESGEHADDERWHCVIWCRDERVVRWQPFHYLPEAAAAFEGG